MQKKIAKNFAAKCLIPIFWSLEFQLLKKGGPSKVGSAVRTAAHNVRDISPSPIQTRRWTSPQIMRRRGSGGGFTECINGLQRCLQEERVQIGGIGSWLPSSCLPSTKPGFQAEDPDATVLGHLMTIIFLKDGASGAQRCPLC